MIEWIIAVGALLAVAAIVVILVRQGHPGDAASAHPVVHPRETRPAGPDAETQDPDELSSDQRPPD